MEGGHDRSNCVQSSYRVWIGERRRSGLASLVAHHAGETGHRLDRWAERRVVGVLTSGAESRHGAHDYVRPHLAESLVGQVEVAHHSRSEVLDNHVRCRDQVQEQLAALLVIESEGEVDLVAVELIVGAGQPVYRNARIADLDDLCAVVAQDACGQRPGPDAGEVQDSDAIKRREWRGVRSERLHCRGRFETCTYVFSSLKLVLAQSRGPLEFGMRDAHFERYGRVPERSGVRVINFLEQLPVGKLSVFQHLSEFQEGRRWLGPRTRRELEYLCAGLVFHPVDEDGIDLAGVLTPLGEGIESGLLQKFGASEHRKQHLPLPFSGDSERHVAVLAREHSNRVATIRTLILPPPAMSAAHEAAVRVHDGRELVQRGERLDLGDFDPAAMSCRDPLPQSHHRARVRVQARQVL